MTRLEDVLLTLASAAHCTGSMLLAIGRTCRTLRDAALREDVWQQILFAAFPSTAALPAAAFDLPAGRGYRWWFKQRVKQMPDADARPLPALPEPRLRASDLVLFVELDFEGTKHVSYAARGEQLEQFLLSGRIRIPKAAIQAPLVRKVRVDCNFDADSAGTGGRKFIAGDGKFTLMHFDNAAGEYMDHDDQYGVSDMKISVQLLRLTDFKTSCLLDQLAAYGDLRPVEGRAWSRGAPACFLPPRRALERERDLFEGFEAEQEGGRLPFDSASTTGLLHAHMAARGFHGLECGVIARFKLPPSPRAFVFDEMLTRYHESGLGDTSNGCWFTRLGRFFRNLPDESVLQAIESAGWNGGSEDVTIPGRGYPTMEVDATLVELDVQLWRVSGGAGGGKHEWASSTRAEDKTLLLHLLDALVWPDGDDMAQVE